MSLEIKQIIEICEKQFNCKVQDKGFGIHSGGYRTLHIIVGKKVNPGYDPNNAWPAIAKNPKLIPDARVVHIQPWISEDDLITRLGVIKKSLPENRELPIRDEKIAGIEPKDKKFRETPPPAEAPTSKVEIDENDVHPADKIDDLDKEDVIVDALANVVSSLDDIGKRLNKLENKEVAKKGSKK